MIIEYVNIYSNLVNLSRNKILFSYFTKKDTFSDRLIIFLIHLAFFLKKFKKNTDHNYLQDLYDYTFKQIENDIREIGYGDQSVNKKMKTYVNLLYSIINKIDNWENYNFQQKMDILKIFIEIKDNNEKFLDYFENYSKYLSKITLNSFTKSVRDHKF
tara:strand:+ start:1711 stop:2184 length:474 start_codon:yes stop_codon:yes gene_type:complete